MKKIFALATVFIALGLTSCKKDEPSTSNITTSNVTTTVSAGTWRVTYYWDTNRDETANFNGFNFTFGASNLVSASNSLLTINGTWSIANDDSKIKLILPKIDETDIILPICFLLLLNSLLSSLEPHHMHYLLSYALLPQLSKYYLNL